MANVIRLVNGGSIQVRTGVIQGVGPQGPTGPVGGPGPDGEQGPQGEQGPMGQILQSQGLTKVNLTNTITANTDTVISFGSRLYDDPGFFPGTSNSNIVLPEVGDYLLSCWLKCNATTGATIRDIWFNSVANGLIARASRTAVASTDIYLNLTHPYRVLLGMAPETLNVLVRSGSAITIDTGACTVTRIGSGPKGDKGDQGIQGNQGIKGDKGDTGPAGNANAGFAKYSDMLPH